MDFIYERFRLPSGVKIEEVTGGDHYKGKVWTEIARQIYCENGKEGYRELGHFSSGAPFIYGTDERISISHTEGCFVVATLAVDKEANLSVFSPKTALGVDVEKAGREKVMKIRDRFLSDEELKLVSAQSLEANIIAWTCKEAMLKAGMNPAIDWHNDIIINRLPSFDADGEGAIRLDDGTHSLCLHSFRSDDFIITVASPVSTS